ncbi:MAG TPA: hypothetical protein VD973_07060 [Symbiobacteriaceae bacterium]|nr:hypothetical protein [Symbiobacteriaceae bacterium]
MYSTIIGRGVSAGTPVVEPGRFFGSVAENRVLDKTEVAELR